MKRLIEILGDHGEALIFALVFVITFAVIIPTMNENDAAKHAAQMASR